jgi:hypothetical protein
MDSTGNQVIRHSAFTTHSAATTHDYSTRTTAGSTENCY